METSIVIQGDSSSWQLAALIDFLFFLSVTDKEVLVLVDH
jgi:hypothetical protein